jgi:hypothetical protein
MSTCSFPNLPSAALTTPRRDVLRWLCLVAQATTIIITWQLWQDRAEPPLLPAIVMPALSFGPWLLASLAFAAVRPVHGTVVHCALLLLAMIADQTREQPQVLSLAIVLVATLPLRGAREVGVLHLAALWFWSGLGKLTSERFLTVGGAWLLDARSVDALANGDSLATFVAVALGVGELTLGVMVLVPRTRHMAAWLGAAMHAGILMFLCGRGWNAAVWPWNACLVAASLVLLRGDAVGGLGAMWRRALGVRIAAVAFAALPIGFHLGVVDAPFAQQVYTSNTCHALVLRADGRTEALGELRQLGVPLPPVPRIVRAWFAASARPGDRLILVDDRPLAALAGPRERLVTTELTRLP